MDLKQITEKAFNKIYGNDESHKLIHVGTQKNTGFMTFIITNDFEVMCTFYVSSNNGVFQATSNDYLLSNQYALKTWIEFLTTIQELVKGE